ncbi:Ig-like domain-containing protein [Microvirga sp. M2]|uniref:Ig-like domain-containing protein n=1 Tax=Microvirga sp. M2 TaxID=3073270 RepID=UPI0039C3365A
MAPTILSSDSFSSDIVPTSDANWKHPDAMLGADGKHYLGSFNDNRSFVVSRYDDGTWTQVAAYDLYEEATGGAAMGHIIDFLVDAEGAIHVVFNSFAADNDPGGNFGERILIHGKFVPGGDWTFTEVDRRSNQFGFDDSLSLAQDATGNVHLAYKIYSPGTGSDIVHATMDGSGNWVRETVAHSTDPGGNARVANPELAVAPDGTLRIVYTQGDDPGGWNYWGGSVYLATKAPGPDSSWIPEKVLTVGAPAPEYFTTQFFDAQGNLHVFYAEVDDAAADLAEDVILYEMTNASGSWVRTEIVTGSGTIPVGSGYLAKDGVEYLLVQDRGAWFDGLSGAKVYVRTAGGGWVPGNEVPLSPNATYNDVTLTMGADGKLMIVAQDGLGEPLHYYYGDPGGVDTTGPSVTSLAVPANGTYGVGQELTFTVNFDETVIVATDGGAPRLAIDIGGQTVYAAFVSGSGSATLTFRYTIQTGQSDANGIAISCLELNGGSLKDAAGNDAALSLNVVPSTSGVTVDGIAPNTPSLPGLSAGSDTGWSSTDNITGDSTPTFLGGPGSAEPGATIRLYDTDGVTVIAQATVHADGSWVATSSMPLSNGSHMITARVTDAAGNASAASGPFALTIDTGAPAVTITSNVAQLKGGETATITFTFSEDPGATFTWDGSAGDIVVSGGTLSAISGSGSTRTATFTPTAGVNGGSASITVPAGSYTDAAGNNGAAGSMPSLTFDTLAPGTPTAPVLAAGSDTGLSNSDRITANARPTFTGSAEAGATVVLYDTTGNVIGSGIAVGGTWSITPDAALAEGRHTIHARAIDAAGNESAVATGQDITIDMTAPALSITSSASQLKSGESATITFTFSEDPGATFTHADISVVGGTLGALSGTGTTRTAVFTPAVDTDGGTASITVAAGAYTDTAGNAGGAGTTPTLTFDTVAPSAPSAPDLAAASDTGISNTDNITGATTPTFTGTAEIGATVRLYDGVTEIGSAVATDGTWSITSSTLGAGAHTITAVATDAAGNVGLASPPLEIQVVTEGPATQVTGMALSDDSGVSATDFVTRTAVQTLAGTLSAALAAGERVEVSFDDGGTWTPALSETPTSWSLAAVLTEGTHTIAVRVVDAIGNTGPVRSQAYTLDTVAPGLTITSNLAALKAHETATITFTFSEDPGASFTLDAISVVGGTLGALSGTGLTRTAVFTPEPGVSGGTATIAVTAGTYTDAAGNAGGAGAPLALALDTRAPLVDGVAVVDRTETTNLDGSVSQVVTIPVVTAGRSETDGSALYADIPLVTAGGRPVLTVQVGVGLGLTASGFAAPKAAGASLADLIREIQAHAGAADRTTLSGGGAGFLAGLPAHTPLLVQALTLTQAGAVAGVPLVISGDSSAQAPATALVIDARGLSAGTVIALDNVAFATILGAVRVTGGAGSQVVYGDGAAQHIVLGADDDTLHGGGGNDYIGSKGGNDWLYGDAGNDTVAGGIGDDHLYGGTGHDRLLGEAGHDRLEGGSGNDTLLGGSGHDTLAGGTGHDRLYGDAGNDRLYGGSGHDRLDGGSGHDRLDGGAGNDTLLGGTGNDTLVGGLGRDQLGGGAGRDVFVFTTVAESRVGAQRDVIHDFQSGHDRIDLRGIDANTRLAGNQAFSWTGADGPFLHPQESAAFLATGFTGRAGELRFANGLLMGDVDGDGRADFEIRIVGPLAAGDVIL